MKRYLITILIALGTVFLAAPAAKAEYAFSVTYGTGNTHLYNRHPVGGRHSHNRGHFNRGYYYWPLPVVRRTEVITVYKEKPKEIILTSRERLGISDIIVLSRAGISDDNIIDKIAKSGSVFELTVEEVEALRREGVSARVVNFMLKTK